MGVYKPETSQNINKVNRAIKSVVEHAVNILRPIKAVREVVVDVQQGVQDDFERDEGNHDNAEKRGLFFQGVVVFVDEPFGACLQGDHYDYQYQEKTCVHLDVDLVGLNVLLASAEFLTVVLHLL